MDLKRLEYLNQICKQLDSSVPVARNISRYLREICYGSRLSKDEFGKVDMCPRCLTPCSAGRFSLRLQSHKKINNNKKSSRLLRKQPTILNNFQKFLLSRIQSKGDNVMRLTCLECHKVSKEHFKKNVLVSPVLIDKNLPKDDLGVVEEIPKSKKTKKKKRQKDLLCGLKSSAVAEVRQNKARMLNRSSRTFLKEYGSNPNSIITTPKPNQSLDSALLVNCFGERNFVANKTVKNHAAMSKAYSEILDVTEKLEDKTVALKKSEGINRTKKNNDENECGAIYISESNCNDSGERNITTIEFPSKELKKLSERNEIIPDDIDVVKNDLTNKKLNVTVDKNNYKFSNRINHLQSLPCSEYSVKNKSLKSSNNFNVEIKGQTTYKLSLQTNSQSCDKKNIKSNKYNNKRDNKINLKLSSNSGDKSYLVNKGNNKSKNKKLRSRISISNCYKVFEKSNCRNSLCVKDLLNVT